MQSNAFSVSFSAYSMSIRSDGIILYQFFGFCYCILFGLILLVIYVIFRWLSRQIWCVIYTRRNANKNQTAEWASERTCFTEKSMEWKWREKISQLCKCNWMDKRTVDQWPCTWLNRNDVMITATFHHSPPIKRDPMNGLQWQCINILQQAKADSEMWFSFSACSSFFLMRSLCQFIPVAVAVAIAVFSFA